MRDFVFKLRMWVYRHIPIRRDRIVFLSHLGKTYACNPRYFCEYLAEKYPGKYELIWIYDKQYMRKPILHNNVKAVPFFSHECLRMIATAGVIVSNTRISDAFFFKKRKGQFYLQTWHSSMRLKCIEADAKLGDNYEQSARRDSAQIDLIISGSDFSSYIYRNSFWYRGAILETGTPRVDWLKRASDSLKADILSKANLEAEVHYLLYAPTFRKDGTLGAYDIDFVRLTECLGKKYGGRWKILYRLHPNLKGQTTVNAAPDIIDDMTDYDDIQELLVISEFLITDYSSSMFDAAIISKPCILYASDIDKYLAIERNLYFDIKSLPFPLAKDNKELAEIVERFDVNKYNSDIKAFNDKLGLHEDGNSCAKIEKIIAERI